MKKRKLNGESLILANSFNTKSVKDLVQRSWRNTGEFESHFESSSLNQTKLLLKKLNCDKSYEILNWKPVLDFEKLN